MRAAIACGLLLTGAVLSAQPKSPGFLADGPLDPRLDTLHLVAQAEGPVRVDSAGRATVTVVVSPKAGMHVYAADADGYVPFTIDVQATPPVVSGKRAYPRAETYVFPPTGETSRVYVKPFRVTQSVVMGADARKALAAGRRLSGVVTLRYQACDETVCYRPTTGRFVVEFVE